MKLLMHLCCANCALHPLQTMAGTGIEVKGFWFNPNIHPFTEYMSRLEAVKQLELLCSAEGSPPAIPALTNVSKMGFRVEYIDYYGLREYIRNVAGNEENRCTYCYTIRLEETAKRAKELNADAFTTSMLVSPYQKFDLILDIGKMLQDRYSVEFYQEDFRTGFNEGMRMSKELGLYRQKYCGCIYSEMERYLGNKR